MNKRISSNGLSQLSVRHGSVAACLLLSALALPAIAAPNAGEKAAELAPKPGYSLLHSFDVTDGALPWSDLVKGKNGNYYGTTLSAGPGGAGTVFEISSKGTLTTLYGFTGGSDGGYPTSLPRLFVDKSGNLYGTAGYGGASGCSGSGCGTVFEVTPSGTETVLHSFNSATDGANPSAGVIGDKKGNLYGTAIYGGSSGCSGYGCGTVYKLAANGTFTVLHAFGGSDGEYPEDGLIRDKAGNLYGTTIDGGSYGYGTVFEIAADGTNKLLHSFAGGSSDGNAPNCALIMDASGNLYGTTAGDDGGTIFKIATNGTETLLYNSATLSFPSTLSMDNAGNLYGTTRYGGSYGEGNIYELATNGTFSTLHNFAAGTADGGAPIDGVTINKSASEILGTTNYGGGTGCGGYGCGTVFRLKQ